MTAYQSYVAYYREGQWQLSLTSVLAPSVEVARTRLEQELRKPGRYRYWQLWHRDGKLVKVKEETHERTP